jgi:hypothetical protein
MSQVGRIGGQVLSNNLLRNGIDLSFETDLLYIDVNNNRIGINTDAPIYTFDVNSEITSTNGIATNSAIIDNIQIQSPNVFTTSVGPINISPAGPEPTAIFDKLATQFLEFDGNAVRSISNQNIRFDPNGTGTIQLQADTNVTGDIRTSGNITIVGNLSKQGNIIIGDDVIDFEGNVPENDTVDFNVPFDQDLEPGIDNAYDLGGSLGDSTAGRWRSAIIDDWTNITTLNPLNARVSDQILINGVSNTIFGIQSNEDILLLPDTGIIYIEDTKWQGSDITNLDNTPLRLASTGIGYYRFAGNNAMIIPAGGDAARPLSPEVGDTRWNTDSGYLECFDGTVYIIATGPGDVIDVQDMEDLGNVYTLILG